MFIYEAASKPKTLFVSDFDDTLAQTEANVYVTRNGKRQKLTPAEFAVFTAEPGDQFDFTEFDKLINPKPIERFVKLLKLAQAGKADKVVVLTARGHTLPVAQFLRMQGIKSGVAIAALGDANPQKKADYIDKNIRQDGYTRVAFIDDSPKNVAAVTALRKAHPNVKILVHQAKEHPSEPEKEITPKKSSTPQSSEKKSNLKQFLRRTIKNPETGNNILIQTALRMDPNHPAKIAASRLLDAETKKLNITLRSKNN